MRSAYNIATAVGLVAALVLPVEAIADHSLLDVLTSKGVLTEQEATDIRQQQKADKPYTIGGRIQADFATYKDPVGVNLADGAQFRRARLFVKGGFDDFHYKSQVDFAGNSVTVQDMYLEYTGLPVNIRLGNANEPFTMEDNTSSKYVTFMERAMINAFAPGRNMGLMFSAHGDRWGTAAGLYTNNSGGANKGVNSKIDVSGRLTVAPLHDRTHIVHLGASVNYHVPDSSRSLRFSARPDSHVTGMKFVDTGTLTGVRKVTQYGIEAATVFDTFSLQGEYVRSTVDYQAGLTGSSKFSGYYIFASWFLTGEHRSYSVAEGVFGRTHPKIPFRTDGEGWGAWELAARLSQLDLEDKAVAGGKEQNITLALNWYPLSHVRWMFNWVRARTDRSPLAPTQTGFGPDVYQMRAQVDF